MEAGPKREAWTCSAEALCFLTPWLRHRDNVQPFRDTRRQSLLLRYQPLAWTQRCDTIPRPCPMQSQEEALLKGKDS